MPGFRSLSLVRRGNAAPHWRRGWGGHGSHPPGLCHSEPPKFLTKASRMSWFYLQQGSAVSVGRRSSSILKYTSSARPGLCPPPPPLSPYCRQHCHQQRRDGARVIWGYKFHNSVRSKYISIGGLYLYLKV